MIARRTRRLPNRWRITLWVLVVVVAITTVAGVVLVQVVEQRFVDEADAELQAEVEGMVQVIDTLGLEVIRDAVDGVKDGVAGQSHAMIVVGPTGIDLEIASGPANDRDPLPDLSERSLADLRGRAGTPFEVAAERGPLTYRAVTGQLADGRVLVAARPLTGLDDAVRALIGSLVVVALVMTGALAVAISLVSNHITRPLDAMIETAQDIGSGSLHARVSAGGVDDVDRLAGALNAMLDRLEAAFADRQRSEDTLRRFVADASHELRTPVAAILGYAELHQSGITSSSEQVAHAMDRIAAEGERMRLLVEELLLLARFDHGRPADLGPVDVGELVATAVADARTIDPDRPTGLDRPDAALVVDGDAVSLRQAVDNLLANTRAHTPVGTPVSVSVSASPGPDGAEGVQVVVADAGPGIDPSDLPHVFDRFYRSEASRARPGGAGLGLAIVAAVAEAHGGHIEADSTAGEGARFTWWLPAGGVGGP